VRGEGTVNWQRQVELGIFGGASARGMIDCAVRVWRIGDVRLS
jgi:hypothetical protein